VVVDVGDYYVTPGLVDARASVDFLGSDNALQPDRLPAARGDDRHDASAGRSCAAIETRVIADVLRMTRCLRAPTDESGEHDSVMEKLMKSGVPFAKVVERGTAVPANVIVRDVGRCAKGRRGSGHL